MEYNMFCVHTVQDQVNSSKYKILSYSKGNTRIISILFSKNLSNISRFLQRGHWELTRLRDWKTYQLSNIFKNLKSWGPKILLDKILKIFPCLGSWGLILHSFKCLHVTNCYKSKIHSYL